MENTGNQTPAAGGRETGADGLFAGAEPAALLEDAGIGVLRLDRDRRIVSVDSLGSGLLDKPAAELEGRALKDAFPEALGKELDRAADRAQEKSALAIAELHLPHPAGLWLSCSIRPIPEGFLLALRDITPARKTALELTDCQERLRAIHAASFGGRAIHEQGIIPECTRGLSETTEFSRQELERKVRERTGDLEQAAAMLEGQKELLQAIIDHIPVMIALLDPAGRVKLVNREYERVSGWTPEEARTMDVFASSRRDAGERRGAVEATGNAEPRWIDFDMHTRSGEVVNTSWANVSFADGSAMGIGIDLSARRKMERDLLRLATAVQQSGEGISVYGVEGEIVYVNPAFEIISGYSREELAGKTIDALGDYFAGYSIRDLVSKAVQEGRTLTGRQQRRRKTGETIEVDLSVSPVRDETGRITNFVSIIRDVTQETVLQRQLSLSQRMEAIGSLAGGIAHDLKNILTPILINTELALEDVDEESPARPVLGEVLEAARLGRDLVQQILTFSRRTPRTKFPVNVSAVVRETLSFLRSSLPSTIEIIDGVEDPCVMVFADPTQIKQVLINLGSNAGHAMRGGGGTLEVRESKATLDEPAAVRIFPDLKAGAYVEISVHDTGSGMDEETMEHIFEPFFTTKKGEGTGMGLAVAHGIVRDHQGAITVESSPGRGSTFTILLPELTGGGTGQAGGTGPAGPWQPGPGIARGEIR